MKKMRAIIAENSLITAMMTKFELEKMGFEVINTVNTQKDFDYCVRTTPPTIIVMDIHLEGLYNGIQIIKNTENLQNTDIFFLVTFYNQQVQHRIDEVGAAGFLKKPFDDVELCTILSKYCNFPSKNAENGKLYVS